MRDYFNPAALLAVVGLFAWGLADGSNAGLWALAICVTAFVVNGALSLARMMAHRPVLMGVVWSAAYLILSTCAWLMLQSPDSDLYAEDKAALQLRLREWKELGNSPFSSPQPEQDCLVVLAAGLGKNMLLRELLELPEAQQNPGLLQLAARAAVENGQKRTLLLLLEHGVSADSVAKGDSLLSSAVINGRRDIAELLLKGGAQPNAPDAEGIPPIMHAVINDDLPTARLLMQYGADASRKAADGRDAHSCSRSEEMDGILNRQH